MKRCPSCGEENADRARFCQSCATSLGGAETPAADVRKVVTIVFADITGSTALGERLDPESLRRVMGRYFDEMAVVVARHGGTVEKFIGDAVMAVFGIPRLHEDDALRAVRAAIGMRDALDALNVGLLRDYGEGLAARTGVNTGEVVAGDASVGQRLITGDAVNVAARLEQAASPGEILLGDPTFRLVKDAVEVEPVDALALKGKEERVPAFRLLAVSAHAAGHERRLDSPMVGRAKELSLLEQALEGTVTDRTSHLFTLMGPAGVGKSRLVHEFRKGTAREATLLRGRCLSYGEGITFFPLADVVHQAAGIAESDPPAAARSKLDAVLADAHDGDRIASQVAGLFGWGELGAMEDTFWAVRKMLEHLARERPVVLVFDDIHWGEPTFLDLIDYLADWTREAALLLLCIARPELLEVRPGWGGGKMNATSILLEPLPGDEASQLIDNLLGRSDIPQVAHDRILEAAEGNPLFVEEMIAMLIDDGLLRFEDGAWRSAEDLANVTVPPTIHLLLAARLDRLETEERGVIERGAVEGKVFHSGAVTTLSPETARPQVRSRLLALARKELIRPDRAEFAGEDAFRFRHLLIRDAAYQAMPKEHRADLHERFAGWLEEAAGQRIGEYEEILGHHLEQAYRYRLELGAPDERARELARTAGRHLVASAVRTGEREELTTAATFFVRAVDLLDGVERLRAMVRHAEILEEMAEFQDAADAATQAEELAETLGDRAESLRAALVRIMSIGQVDPAQTIAEAATEVQAILDEAMDRDDGGLADQARLALARIWFYLGKTSRTFETLEPLMGRAAALPRRDRREVGELIGTSVYFGATSVVEAFVALDRSGGFHENSLSGEAFMLRVRGGLLAMTGSFEEANAEFDSARRLIQELGDPFRERISPQIDGEALRLEGRTEEAERVFRSMIDALDAMGETGFNSTISALLAHTLCDQDRFAEAERLVERSRGMAAEDDFVSQASWRMARARVLVDRGSFEEALVLADEAVAINEATDYLSWQGEGLGVRGWVLEAAGRDDDARAAYEESLDRYERKGNVAAAARVRAQIDGL